MTAPAPVFEFRRPLGLALAGGAALGSWQTSAVHELVHGFGLHFDAALGFSAGALNATGYFLGRMDEALARWRNIESARLLRYSPRLFPPTLFSGEPLWEQLSAARDENHARSNGRGRLVVVSACRAERRRVYAVFDHKGAGRWDGPLAHHLAGSCAIPWIFPPVKTDYRGKNLTLVDGGVTVPETFSFAELAHCRDVIVVEMVRPEEIGRKRNPWSYKTDQRGRETSRRLMNEGIDSLRRLANPPRIFRLAPSRPLAFPMLSFKAGDMADAMSRGLEDARAFMASPQPLAA